ncbi:MAG: ATP synthase subunit I [Cellvibrionales bacterium]|nr:ATP synthase subunit I [Cellvibrionales bacterium]
MRRRLRRYFGWQLLATAALVLAGFGLRGHAGALAAALGCAIALIPQTWFTLRMFCHQDQRDRPTPLAATLRRAMAGKMALVLVVCMLAFHFFEIQDPVLLFTALPLMLITQIALAAHLLAPLHRALPRH